MRVYKQRKNFCVSILKRIKCVQMLTRGNQRRGRVEDTGKAVNIQLLTYVCEYNISHGLLRVGIPEVETRVSILWDSTFE